MSAVDNAALQALLEDARRHYDAAETCRAVALRSNSQVPALQTPSLKAIFTGGEVKFTMLGGNDCWRPTAEAAHEAYVAQMRRFVESTRDEMLKEKATIDKAMEILGDRPEPEPKAFAPGERR